MASIGSRTSRFALMAMAVCVAGFGQASAADREHSAHEHGVSQLHLALEGKDLEIEFVAPASDIVGFEHAANTDAEKAAIAKARKTLANGPALFVFPAAAKCAVEDVAVRSTQEATREAPHASHGHGHSHSHGHGEKGHDKAPEIHSEFHVHYHFHCTNPAAVTHIDVKLFEPFGRMREIDVQALLPGGQKAQELVPGNARLKL